MSEFALQSQPRLAPGARLQIDPATQEPVLLYPEGLLQLNTTAAAILERCDGCTPLREIVATLAEDYEVAPEELAADVQACLADLRNRGLVIDGAPA